MSGPSRSALSVGSSVELGYAARTSDVVLSVGAFIDIPGLSLDVTVGTIPVVLKFDADFKTTGVNSSVVVAFYEGAVELRRTNFPPVAASGGFLGVHSSLRLQPTAGLHTYKVRAAAVTAGATLTTSNATDGTAAGVLFGSFQVVTA